MLRAVFVADMSYIGVFPLQKQWLVDRRKKLSDQTNESARVKPEKKEKCTVR